MWDDEEHGQRTSKVLPKNVDIFTTAKLSGEQEAEKRKVGMSERERERDKMAISMSHQPWILN